MTITSEITDLQNNLAAAKTAVTNKGGTVGDTGLAGLASEIATIPSGGSLANYGSITYLDSNNVEQTLTLATEEDFIELTYGADQSILTINNTQIGKDKITSVTVADGVQYLPTSFCKGSPNLITVTLPSSVHYIGSSFLAGCTSFNSTLNLANVKFVDDVFLQGCAAFNQSINLPKVDEIRGGFLQNCSAFNSTVTLNDNIKTIGDSFMRGCTSFAQRFTVPSGLEYIAGESSVGTYFMYQCTNFTGPLVCNGPSDLQGLLTSNQTLGTNNASALMYTTGVTLTGTYAQTWKDRFPDRTTSPYRKLIVSS